MAEPQRRCRPLLGTFVTIEADGDVAAIDRAFARIAHVHDRMSFHAGGSDLAALRTAPWGARVAVAAETVAVLRHAARLHAETDGLFDVTVARRLVAAGFLPRPAGIDLRRMTGTAADIEIDGDAHVRVHRPALIDLGGIAKGYAVDLAVAALVAGGAAQAIVDAGGDMRLFGPVPRQIGLRDADGIVRAAIETTDIAVATSSNRHLRRRHAGRAASPHVGLAGRPVLAEDSVTVLAEDCMTADAFTKIALADRARVLALLPRHGGALLDPAPLAVAA